MSVRPNVAVLPTGYRLRSYQLGDEVNWQKIQVAAEPFFAIADDLFEKQFGDHPEALVDRMFFVDAIDEAGQATTVGTASGWWKDDWQESGPWGQVHWVAVAPEHQGRGLTKPLMNRVMARMAQSHDRAMLGTSTGRVWVIKVYLDVGFMPDEGELTRPEVKEAWQQTQKVLRHPVLEQILA